jgi:hypothetical protein
VKNAVFCYVKSCGSCNKRRFGGTYRFSRLLVTASVFLSSPILVTLKMEAIRFLKIRFLQESHGVTLQKTAFSYLSA